MTRAAVIICVICRLKLWKSHWTWLKRGGGGPSRWMKYRQLQSSEREVTNTARLLHERKENMLSLFCREASAAADPRGKATAIEMWRQPIKRGLCFGWRPTKSWSRENRGWVRRQWGYYPHRTWAPGLIYNSNVEFGKLLSFNENQFFWPLVCTGCLSISG